MDKTNKTTETTEATKPARKPRGPSKPMVAYLKDDEGNLFNLGVEGNTLAELKTAVAETGKAKDGDTVVFARTLFESTVQVKATL